MDIKEILFSYLYQIAEQHNLTVHIEEEGSPIPTCTIPEKKSIFLNIPILESVIMLFSSHMNWGTI